MTLTRRDVLKAGAAGGGALALGALPSTLLEAIAATPATCGSLSDVKNIVIFIQENRAFDHYFGRYRGVRGYDDRTVKLSPTDDGTTVFKQSYPSGAIPGVPNPLLPFHIVTNPPSMNQGECTNDIGHQWADQHAMWNNGAMDSWVTRHLADDASGNGKFAAITMGYYEGSPARDHSGDVDLYWALADNFTICDNYYCSVIGGTDINRLYSMTGTIDPDCWDGGGQFLDTKTGTIQSPGADLGTAGRWRPYPELLTGAGITWKVYGTPDAHTGDNVLRYFPQYRPVGGNATLAADAFGSNAFPADFAADAAAGMLPQVSWVLGSLVDSEHAPAPIEWGQDDASKVMTALLASPQWPSTALFITYDENGGFFDHVPPPVPPAATAGEFLDVAKLGATALSEGAGYLDEPIGLGFRVPALVISPFSRNPDPSTGPLVCSDPLDHTSLLRFVEAVFGVKLPRRDPSTMTPGLSAWREAATGDMTSAFNFGAAPDVSAPVLPMTNRADPRVIAECPAATGTLASSSFSAGYPVPATATMPMQETSPGPVKRPTGLEGACPPSGVPEIGIPGALWALPVIGAAVIGVRSFLRRRGEGLASSR
ncbi:MAG: twin-arginine translocation signal domain-containing protein [Candidatus Dormibacteraeota bacterium]|nr:twin-arginine translocation signal domain-containing protein [Candidatus Dormibacteraeota bacterium]MBV8445345.1 twin-arginine translocation signal domain-containing protein [Candidatus Dormibacteraeota bacterium]